MRFPAIQIQQPRRPQRAADLVRPPETPPWRPQERVDTPKSQELPLDLDQRVRLVGEW